MESLLDSHIWLSLITLIALEIVLGVDNIVFISIASARLPRHLQDRARKVGLSLALFTRLLFLWFMYWLANIHTPLFALFSHSVTIRDLVFLFGGAYLLFKGFEELLHMRDMAKFIEPKHKYASFTIVVLQIMLFDIVFSIDSVITAIGIAKHFWVMATAVTVAIGIMLVASKPLGEAVIKYPKVKLLAVCFLVFIGIMLLSSGVGYPIPHAYLYVSMVVAILIQIANIMCLA
jgi:predicted tellurium resistance membrane protein TerC